jgi:DNA polymerase-1
MEKKHKKKRIVLLDAHAIIHRSYHALPAFVSSKGEATGALFGIVSMLLKIDVELSPDYLIACYDLPKPTFRHIAYEGYKAGRQKSDDALVDQIIKSRGIFEAFSIPIYEYEGFEADDILGTICEQTKDLKEYEVIIASGDMDTMQLIEGERVRVYTFKKGVHDTVLYNQTEIEKRFGFSPKQIPDYKGFAGDSSDNIMGIKGIGDKTATMLIKSFGSVEGVYKEIQKNEKILEEKGFTKRISALIAEGEEDAFFSKTLATIRRDAPVVFSLGHTWKEGLQQEKILSLLERYEFRGLHKRTLGLLGKEEEKDEEVLSEQNMENLKIFTWLRNSERTNPSLDECKEEARVPTGAEAFRVAQDFVYQDENLKKIYESIEKPLIPIMKKLTATGILIDKAYAKELEVFYEKEKEELSKNIYRAAGREFNISSPKQLGEILFDELQLEAKGLRKTATGSRSTNSDTLQKLSGTHPIIPLITRYREVDKILGTYVIPLPKTAKEDGRVHSLFIQTGAATGRFSSTEPNMQNIPTPKEGEKNIRNIFVAAPGCIFLSFDYSQIELRVAAMMSQDEKLLSLFKKGGDIHNEVARYTFSCEEGEVTGEMRKVAKAINFGILYGMGVTALTESLHKERKEAQHFFDEYKKNFSALAAYLESVKQEVKMSGYTETLFGRKRMIPLARSPIPFLRAQGERMAINAPIQGTAADILKLALIEVDSFIEKLYPGRARLVLQVHDEIVLEVSEDLKDEVSAGVIKIMENILGKNKHLCVKPTTLIPLLVSSKEGGKLGNLE